MRGIPVPQGRTANTEVRSKRSSPEHAPAGPAGRATGGIYLAIFGGLWAVAGVGGVGGFEAPAILRWTMLAVIGAVTLGLCLQSVRLARRVRILPRDATSAADATRRRVNRRFGLIVTIGIAAVFVVMHGLRAAGQDRFILDTVTLVVGAHFLPLAALYRVDLYYVTGLALIVLGCIGLVGTIAATQHRSKRT